MFLSKELLNEQKYEIGIDQPGVIKCFLVLGQLWKKRMIKGVSF